MIGENVLHTTSDGSVNGNNRKPTYRKQSSRVRTKNRYYKNEKKVFKNTLKWVRIMPTSK